LCVPDDPFFYGVVMGLLKQATFRYYWSGTAEDVTAVTERMLTMYYDYQDQVGCMICEMVAECLETDAATQAAIRSLIRGMTPNPATDPYGQNVPESELTRDVAAGTNPTCNLDILWSQCLNVVKVTNLAIVDVLEKFEVSTNIAELVNGLIDIVPVLGTAKQIIGASGALDLINYFQESLTEGYLAQYTETPGGVQDQIACALFCACQVDCQITIQRVEEVMRARLAAHIAVPEVTDFTDLITTIAGIEPDTTYVVDLAFWFGWVAVRTGNFLFGQTFNGGLDLIVGLAADEPDNGWELLCDCPDCDLTYTIGKGSADGDWIDTAAPANVQPLMAAEYPCVVFGGSEGYIDIDGLATSVRIEYDSTNLGGGSDDHMLFRLGDFDGCDDFIGGDTTAAPDVTGEITVTSPTPVSRFWFALGYTSAGGFAIYDNNVKRIRVIEICE